MTARFIVCEKSGDWATAIRWAGGSRAPRLYEVRSLDDCREELNQFPASFVGIEATPANLEWVFRLLWEMHQHFPRAHAVVFALRCIAPWEDALREAGALHVTFSPRRLDRVVRLAERHLKSVPLPRLSLRDTIWSRLPWSEQGKQPLPQPLPPGEVGL